MECEERAPVLLGHPDEHRTCGLLLSPLEQCEPVRRSHAAGIGDADLPDRIIECQARRRTSPDKDVGVHDRHHQHLQEGSCGVLPPPTYAVKSGGGRCCRAFPVSAPPSVAGTARLMRPRTLPGIPGETTMLTPEEAALAPPWPARRSPRRRLQARCTRVDRPTHVVAPASQIGRTPSKPTTSASHECLAGPPPRPYPPTTISTQETTTTAPDPPGTPPPRHDPPGAPRRLSGCDGRRPQRRPAPKPGPFTRGWQGGAHPRSPEHRAC